MRQLDLTAVQKYKLIIWKKTYVAQRKAPRRMRHQNVQAIITLFQNGDIYCGTDHFRFRQGLMRGGKVTQDKEMSAIEFIVNDWNPANCSSGAYLQLPLSIQASVTHVAPFFLLTKGRESNCRTPA